MEAIFAKIGTTNKYFVEFGAEDGIQCNTRYLQKHKGWRGLLMDPEHEDRSINLRREFVTAENVDTLFSEHAVPESFDLLSIDVDGNDYWIWRALERHSPRVVVIEYNACFAANESKTIPYDREFRWDKTDYYGATLPALSKLGQAKGYRLVATDPNGVNAFFVLDQLAEGNFEQRSVEEIYRPAAFKGRKGLKHPPDGLNRPWIEI